MWINLVGNEHWFARILRLMSIRSGETKVRMLPTRYVDLFAEASRKAPGGAPGADIADDQ